MCLLSVLFMLFSGVGAFSFIHKNLLMALFSLECLVLVLF